MTEVALAFADLSEKAKEKARDHVRQYWQDDGWSDYVIADANVCAELLGIQIGVRMRRTMNNKGYAQPLIDWDVGRRDSGVRFEGAYRKPDNMMGILGHAPEDKVLCRIAERLVALQTSTFLVYNDWLSADISTGLKIEVFTVDTEASCGPDGHPARTEPTEVEVRELTSCLHDFADWVQVQLEAEYQYQYTDECIDLQLEDRSFDEDGSIL